MTSTALNKSSTSSVTSGVAVQKQMKMKNYCNQINLTRKKTIEKTHLLKVATFEILQTSNNWN